MDLKYITIHYDTYKNSFFSTINSTNFSKQISDSGKMRVLDSLLYKLKQEGHRILLYSQMTKMMDLLEVFTYY